jgi:hypothetical protein
MLKVMQGRTRGSRLVFCWGVLDEIDRRAAAAGVPRAEAVRRLLGRALATGVDDGVDRSQIARRLAMTPAERLETMAEEARRLLALGRRAR